jgi:hypothetical protein
MFLDFFGGMARRNGAHSRADIEHNLDVMEDTLKEAKALRKKKYLTGLEEEELYNAEQNYYGYMEGAAQMLGIHENWFPNADDADALQALAQQRRRLFNARDQALPADSFVHAGALIAVLRDNPHYRNFHPAIRGYREMYGDLAPLFLSLGVEGFTERASPSANERVFLVFRQVPGRSPLDPKEVGYITDVVRVLGHGPKAKIEITTPTRGVPTSASERWRFLRAVSKGE